MPRIARPVAVTIAAFLLFVAGAAVLLLVLVDEQDIARFLEKRVTEETGRRFAIGALEIGFDWPRLTFAMADVTLANPGWAEPPYLLRAGTAGLALDLSALLHASWRYPEVRLTGIELNLLRDGEGRVTWDLGGGTGPTGPEGRSDLPRVEKLVVEDLRLRYDDRLTDSARRLELDNALVVAEGDGLSASAEGRWEGLPLHLTGTGGPLDRLRDPGQPYPVSVDLAVGGTLVQAEGALRRPLALRDFDLELHLTGPDLGRLFPIAGIPAPPTPPYTISGQVHRDGSRLVVERLNGRFGNSDLHGDLAIDPGATPPRLTGSLRSGHLDTRDFGDVAGHRDRRLIPRVRIDERYFRAVDADLTFDGEEVNVGEVPLGGVRFHVRLDGGRMRADPFRLELAGGAVSGAVTVDASEPLPRAAVDLEVRAIRVGRLLPATEMFDATRGTLGGHIRLSGRGQYLDGVLSAADGRIELLASGGQVDNLLIEAAGLDLGEMFLAMEEGGSTALTCAAAIATVENGLARIRTGWLDTADSTIEVGGNINLRSESLNLEILSHPKDPSLLSLRRPIAIYGPMRKPTVEPVGPEGVRIFGALALGALVGPVAGLLPLVDTGEGESGACRELMARVKAD